MVIQDELAPLTLRKNEVKTNNLLYYELPWPIESLEGLGREEVELRVTLSYFIEPDIRATCMENLARYPSHRLAFDLKGPDDRHVDAVRRANKAPFKLSPPPRRWETGWELGSKLRERGSIHHDRWRGQARNLARQGGIKVYPKGGWWADRADGAYADVPVQFSLILSIRTPENAADIYHEVQTHAALLSRSRNKSLVALESKVPVSSSSKKS